MRQCPNCAKLGLGPKAETEFNKSKQPAAGGYQYWCRECQKARHVANKEDCNARNRKWHHANPEQAAANSRRWRENNPEAHLAGAKKWAERNPALARISMSARVRKYQAAKIQRTVVWADNEKIKDFYAQAQAAREFFPECSWHVDHFYPMQGKWVSGLHVEENLQVLPGVENQRKSARRVQVEFRPKDMRDLVRAAEPVEKLRGERGPTQVGTPIEADDRATR